MYTKRPPKTYKREAARNNGMWSVEGSAMLAHNKRQAGALYNLRRSNAANPKHDPRRPDIHTKAATLAYGGFDELWRGMGKYMELGPSTLCTCCLQTVRRYRLNATGRRRLAELKERLNTPTK